MGGWSDKTKLILFSTLVEVVVEVVVEVEVELGKKGIVKNSHRFFIIFSLNLGLGAFHKVIYELAN